VASDGPPPAAGGGALPWLPLNAADEIAAWIAAHGMGQNTVS
jgi:hypothetical protein